MKQGQISDKIYQKLMSTGSQPGQQVRILALQIYIKKITPLRPVPSIPGGSYKNLNTFLTPFFRKYRAQTLKSTRKMLESP